MSNTKSEHRMPSLGYAIFVTFGLMLIILGGYKGLKAPVNIMFGFAWLFIVPACMHLGYTFQEINTAMLDQVRKGVVGVFIMLSVGAVIASWIACGCVPAIIYYGLGIVDAKFFLVETFILCVIISTATGTSWGTAATAGVAMLGIGTTLGIPAPMTVGAILSGAMFGDMISPLSDGCNVTAISVEADLIKYSKEITMIGIPAIIVCGIIYVIMGNSYGNGTIDTAYIAGLRQSISDIYHVGLPAFLPFVLLCILLFKQVPAMYSMFISALCGAIVAIFYQGCPYDKIFTYMWSGYKVASDNQFIMTLFNRGGITSMANTAIMALFTYGVIGSLNKVKLPSVLVSPIVKLAKNTLSLAFITEIVAAIGVCFGHGGISVLLTGAVMAPAYREKKLDLLNLARVSGALALPWNAVIPWTTTSIYILGVLGVSTGEYLPYFAFALVMPLMALIFAAFHIHELPLQETAPEIAEKTN